VMALYANGKTRLSNIASWRVKETDRIAAMATELRKLGAIVTESADSIEVSAPGVWHAAAIRTYDDHRIAMCFALAAFNPLAGSTPNVPVRILDPRCVGKTFPEYFETLLSVAEARPAQVPVITVDGPTASGKGTLASSVAQALGYHHLDSGALYRATALVALREQTPVDDAAAMAAVASRLELQFTEPRTSPTRCASKTSALWLHASPRIPRFAPHCMTCSYRFAARPVWSLTGATWGPSSSPTRRSRCSSPRAPQRVRNAGITN